MYRILRLFLSLVILTIAVSAQELPRPPQSSTEVPVEYTTSPIPSKIRIVNPNAHVLAPGDEILIIIQALPQLEKLYRIRADGLFNHRLLGDVSAVGLTLPKLEKTIQLKLDKKLRNPKFKLGLYSVAPSQVTVLGQVMRPGRYYIPPGISIQEAIAQAGGLTPAADTVTALLTRDKLSLNVTISMPDGPDFVPTTVQEGDVIYALEGIRVSVVGEVFKPGQIAVSKVKSGPSEALRLAGGAKPNGSVGRTVLFRPSLKDKVLLDLSPGAKDLPAAGQELKEGDVLVVPPRQAVVFAGGTPKAVNLLGGENILDVITAAGAAGNLGDIKIVRSANIKEGDAKPEAVDLSKYFETHDNSVLIPVNDGDVVLLGAPPQGNFMTSIMQLLYPISMVRMFLP